jgi:hypothetical protein
MNKIFFNGETTTITIEELQVKLLALKLASKTDPMEKMVLVEASQAVVYDTYFDVVYAIG